MDDAPQKKPDAGTPAWVMTFADLMSLLMCFFVLLLSFSEMDAQKFKRLAGSMQNAFGVQRDIPSHEIPKGTSIIAKEFSPGKPTETVLKKIRQNTTDDYHKKLDQAKTAIDAVKRKMAEAMEEEIKMGMVEVESSEQRIIIRILEDGSFESGLADLQKSFIPVMKKIGRVLNTLNGSIKITGHTDDIPISTNRFRSNWDLSASRAVSVAHALIESGDISAKRLEVTGYADQNPLAPNDSKENRAKNRRVDIILVQNDAPKEQKDKVVLDKDVEKLDASTEKLKANNQMPEVEKKAPEKMKNDPKKAQEPVKTDETPTPDVAPTSIVRD